jgi:large subunit ribosomal protein L10
MAKTRQMKADVLSKLEKIFSSSKSIAFVNFHELTVKHAEELRKTLRGNGTGYFVAKKTLIRKALESVNAKGELPALDGEVAVAYIESGSDVTAPAREVFGFEKKFEKAVQLIGGIFEGKFIGKEEVLSLAAIPSRQTLYAQFVNLINSPIQKLVVGLDQVAKTRSS